MIISKILQEIKSIGSYEKKIVYVKDIPLKQPEYKPIALKQNVRDALLNMGIEKLYLHQALAIEHLRKGEDIVIVTSTASGKSMAYMIPIFETLMTNSKATALYISPLNALVNDQLKKFIDFRNKLSIGIDIIPFIRDTPEDERLKAMYMRTSRIILTNPDMIHYNFLRNLDKWEDFFTNLKYVVIDESHSYTGVFGSHVANIIRRLERICDTYMTHPQYICCSATIGNPKDHSSKLIGRNVTEIIKDGSETKPKKFILLNPYNCINKEDINIRSGSFSESLNLFTMFVEKGLQTIVFINSIQTMERMYKEAKAKLEKKGLVNIISPYKAKYGHADRKKIQECLLNGSMRGILSTNALELGIDIGSLDACIINEYPGTIQSTRQRAGRVGRGNKESIITLVAGRNALDQYYMRHPEKLFADNNEIAVLDLDNDHIQAYHIMCASQEYPLDKEEDEKYFGEGLKKLIDQLKSESLLIEDEMGIYSLDSKIYDRMSIRNISNDLYSIHLLDIEKRTQIDEEIDKSIAFRNAHNDAIYMYNGEQYHVKKIDHIKKEIYAECIVAEYYTKPIFEIKVLIKDTYNSEKILSKAGDVIVKIGHVDVIEQVIGYKKYHNFTDTLLNEYSLGMPEVSFKTVAFWIEFPHRIKKMIEDAHLDFFGGIHAIEHTIIALYPLYLLADRTVVGGLSIPPHNEEKSRIFIYDCNDGGIGYAEKGYELIGNLLKAALDFIKGCPCSDGCPSCIQSSNRSNKQLDKYAAIKILEELVDNITYAPLELPTKNLFKPTLSHIKSEKDVSYENSYSTVMKSLIYKKDPGYYKLDDEMDLIRNAKYLKDNGKYDEAIECYKKAIIINPKSKAKYLLKKLRRRHYLKL